MTYPVDPEPISSEMQLASTYPDDYPASIPGDVAPYKCDHDADPPICVCVHDWRVNWGNLPKKTGRRATYVSS